VKTLAYVVFTVVFPADFAGEQWITAAPVECARYIDFVMPHLESAGWQVDAKCEYTNAPVASIQPKPRPTLTEGKPDDLP